MSSEFKKGQLVAVKYGISWEPRVFHREDDEGTWCMDLISHGISPFPSGCVKPAEEVWPEIFLGADREIIDSLQKERDRLHQAIGWLCDRLEEASREHHICPPNALPEDCDNACWECWQQAVYEAMENTKDE